MNQSAMLTPNHQAAKVRPKYQIKPIEGTVERPVVKIIDGKFQQVMVEEPAGFMVFFPSGASMRARDVEQLRELGINPNEVPGLIDMETGEEVAQPQVADLEQISVAKSRNKRNAASDSV